MILAANRLTVARMITRISLFVSLLAVIGLVGCSKADKDDEPVVKGDPVKQKEDNKPLPVVAEAQEMIKNKSYEEAAAMMVQAQALSSKGIMSDGQAAQVRNQMRNLQQTLAEAAARGDQKAIQAIQLLRATSSGGPR